MAEFTRTEIYIIMNGAKPLWLVGADLSGADGHKCAICDHDTTSWD